MEKYLYFLITIPSKCDTLDLQPPLVSFLKLVTPDDALLEKVFC